MPMIILLVALVCLSALLAYKNFIINKNLKKVKDKINNETKYLNLKIDLNDNYDQKELFKKIMNTIQPQNIFYKNESYCIFLNQKLSLRTKNRSASDTLFVPTDDVEAFYVHGSDIFTEMEYEEIKRKFSTVIEEVRKTNEITKINKNKNFIFEAIMS